MSYPPLLLQFPEYQNKDNEDLRITYLDNLLYKSKTGCEDCDIEPWHTLRIELEERRSWKKIRAEM